MNEAVLKEKIAELNDLLFSTTAAKSARLTADGNYVPAPRVNQCVDESLENLRLSLRYLMFDLEATRRENKYLRQMLETRHRPPLGDEGENPPMP